MLKIPWKTYELYNSLHNKQHGMLQYKGVKRQLKTPLSLFKEVILKHRIHFSERNRQFDPPSS